MMRHVYANGVLATRNSLKVRHCLACGYAHLDPVPKQEVLDRFYKSVFWQHKKPGAEAEIDRQLEWWHAVWGDWLTVLGEVATRKTLLDIGSGFGHFPAFARVEGWFTVGVEPNEEAAAKADGRGVPLVNWPYTPSGRGLRYGAASALWVLEHVADPADLLRLLWRDADALLLVVPNELTDAQRLANGVAAVHDWFVDETHVNYFTKKTLWGLLTATGWEIAWCGSTYSMETHISLGRDYTANHALGRELHDTVRRIDLGWTREERLGACAARADAGRDLIVVARRAE